jgi:hypothetical protein
MYMELCMELLETWNGVVCSLRRIVNSRFSVRTIRTNRTDGKVFRGVACRMRSMMQLFRSDHVMERKSRNENIQLTDGKWLPPEVVGSEIEELVSLLQQTYHFKVVCVCLLTPRNRNPVFNAKRVIVNKYLTVVLEHMPNVFTLATSGFCPAIGNTVSSRWGSF